MREQLKDIEMMTKEQEPWSRLSPTDHIEYMLISVMADLDSVEEKIDLTSKFTPQDMHGVTYQLDTAILKLVLLKSKLSKKLGGK